MNEDNFMKQRILGFIAILLLLSMVSSNAAASLLGQTVNCSLTMQQVGGCDIPSAVVGTGSEFDIGNLLIDVTDSSIVITPEPGNDASADGVLTLSNLGWGSTPGQITGFQLSLSGGVDDFAAGDITFGPNSLVINFGTFIPGASTVAGFDVGSSATIQLEVAHVVPIPSSLLLFGTGLPGLIAWRKYTNKNS